MNSKKAKELRRTAREVAREAPQYQPVTLRNGQTINSPYSERGLYRRMKLGDKQPHGKDI